MQANILIVDDDPTSRKLLTATLTSEGHRTVEAENGVDALRMLETQHIDALITDLLMPKMDGYRLCTEVRQSEAFQNMPVVIYTSTYTERSDEELAMRCGANRFIRKPAPAQTVISTVDELMVERNLGRRSCEPGNVLGIEELYSGALVRKLEKRNRQLADRTAALEASESRLRSIFDAEPDGVFVLRRDGSVQEINEAGLEMFNTMGLAEVTSRSMTEFILEANRATFTAAVEAVWQGERACVEFQIAGPQGPVRWLEMHAAPLRNAEGELDGLLGIARDNTARKELEAQFVQAQKMDIVGQLASGVAHDFNNMLAIIMGYSELTTEILDADSPAREYVLTILQTAERAAALTRQLLIFSRHQTIQPQTLDLSEVIVGIDPMLRRLLGENVELITEPEVEIGTVQADPGQIEQVVMNLTVNARDALAEGGHITIRTSRVTITPAEAGRQNIPQGHYSVLSVTDDGCGMTEEVQAKIFQAFFTTKPAGKGTGLGLATCHKIVARWNGHITVESTPGAGTTFRVFLPCVACVAATRVEDAEKPALPRGTETILVVEDEPGLRELTASILQRQGYAVLKAGNGQEALRIVREQPARAVDLVLTDMVMPEMGGKIMGEWMHVASPKTPILYTSGYTDLGPGGTLDAAIDFLPKPYTPSDLIRRVRRAIDAKSPCPESEMALA